MVYFGLKLGQDLGNRAAHPYQEFGGEPLGVAFVVFKCSAHVHENELFIRNLSLAKPRLNAIFRRISTLSLRLCQAAAYSLGTNAPTVENTFFKESSGVAVQIKALKRVVF